MDIGYHLSSEEHAPADLVRFGRMAEQLGFTACSISDHIHPWAEDQGHSGFVWSTLGGLATATERVRLGTMVTCPILRVHPLLVAHAAATSATMAPGRFFLGLGTGERLNEHVLGQHWPPASVRLRMLEEAVAVIRRLWEGTLTTFEGEFFQVENAKLFDVPGEPAPLYVAASGEESGELAGRIGDGLISLAPRQELVGQFREAGGRGKPVIGMTHVCWAPDRDEARRTARTWWPTAGVPGMLNAELPLPQHFEAAASLTGEEAAEDAMVLGADVDEHVEHLRSYAAAGFDLLFVHQVGPDQDGFARFYAEQVLPRVA